MNVERRSAPRVRVLVVDDDPDNRELLEIILGAEGYDVVTADSGHSALRIATAEPAPDVMLLDVMMPEMDGYELAARLKADAATSRIPFLMVSGLDDRASRMRALASGALALMAKPLDSAALCARIREIVRGATAA